MKYTFGVYPLQQYLVPFPGGRLQALGIAWDSRAAPTAASAGSTSTRNSRSQAGDPLHWTGIDQNWNYQCADCHSTNLRKNFDAGHRQFRDDLVGDQRRLRGLPRPGVEPCRLGEQGGRLAEPRGDERADGRTG